MSGANETPDKNRPGGIREWEQIMTTAIAKHYRSFGRDTNETEWLARADQVLEGERDPKQAVAWLYYHPTPQSCYGTTCAWLKSQTERLGITESDRPTLADFGLMTRSEAESAAKLFADQGFTRVQVEQRGGEFADVTNPWVVRLWSVNPQAGNRNLHTVDSPVVGAKHAKLIAKIAKGKATQCDKDALHRIAVHNQMDQE